VKFCCICDDHQLSCDNRAGFDQIIDCTDDPIDRRALIAVRDFIEGQGAARGSV
jgi:hypothetical protein